MSVKSKEVVQSLLDEGYRCILRGYRVNLCGGEKCHLKDRCIFMYGGPKNYVNYWFKEELL